jgi:hypothetical protein
MHDAGDSRQPLASASVEKLSILELGLNIAPSSMKTPAEEDWEPI